MARSDDLFALPSDLPVPVGDGGCDHLKGLPWPSIALPATSGKLVSLADADTEWQVLYCYPRTGLPDQDPPGGLRQATPERIIMSRLRERWATKRQTLP